MKKGFNKLPSTGKDITILVIIGLLLWLTSCGMWDLRGPDEGRYVQVAKEILASGNWFQLTVHGIPYDQKPPLPFWLFALMLKLSNGEVTSWALRLPSVLAAIATVVMTYILGSRSFGRRSGFIAALVLCTSPLFIVSAPSAKLDMLYTAATTAALCLWITQSRLTSVRCVLFWGSLLVAFFIKGPLAFIIVFSAIGWEAYKDRSWAIIKRSRPLLGLTGVAIIIAAWFYIQSQYNGQEFVKQQISGETVQRLVAGDHAEPFWYYFPRIFISILFPWSLLIIVALVDYMSGYRRVRDFKQASIPYFGWLVFPFILLCFANGKRQSYLLPLMPAAAVLLGAYFDQRFMDKPVKPFQQRLVAIVIILLGITVAAAGILGNVYPTYIQTNNIWFSFPSLVLLAICGLMIMTIGWVLIISRRNMFNVFYAVVGVLLLLCWVNFMIIQPAFDPSKSTRDLSKEIDRALSNMNKTAVAQPAKGKIASIGNASKPEYHVYGHYQVAPFNVADVAKTDFVTPDFPDLVIMPEDVKHYAQISKKLLDAGYTHRRKLTASKDDFELFMKSSQSPEMLNPAQ